MSCISLAQDTHNQSVPFKRDKQRRKESANIGFGTVRCVLYVILISMFFFRMTDSERDKEGQFSIWVQEIRAKTDLSAGMNEQIFCKIYHNKPSKYQIIWCTLCF